MTSMKLRIERTWDAQPLTADECVDVEVAITSRGLQLDVRAPYYGDPLPAGPPGPMPMLWEYEVVELFLLGNDERYLEVELGPHGHHLVLQLQGVRNVIASELPLRFTAEVKEKIWHGRALVPPEYLPVGMSHLNAYAIHGQGSERRYLAWRPTEGEQPDFHRLERFGRWRGGASSA